MSEVDYQFVKLDETKIKDLVFLYKFCFGFEPSENELLSKHLNCNGENKFVGFIAYANDNSPAAFYGVYPQLLNYNNQDFLVAQSGDTMTHPSHQKKGLFVALAKHTFEYCKTINIHSIFGFPNQNSYPGFINKLGFKELDRLTGYTFYENRFEIGRLIKGASKRHTTLIIQIMKLIFKEGNHFENSNHHSSYTYIKHDDTFFNSKNKKSNLLIKIKGIDVLLKINENTITIGDINSDNSQKIEQIIQLLKKYCFLFGLRFLNFDLTSKSFLTDKIRNLNPKKFESNRSILLNLNPNLSIDSIEFLGSDIDVF